MTPMTTSTTRRPTHGRVILAAAAAALSFGLLASGCGYNARDAHLAQREAVVRPASGDGTIVVVRDSGWPDTDNASTAIADAGVAVRGGDSIEPTP